VLRIRWRFLGILMGRFHGIAIAEFTVKLEVKGEGSEAAL
jgi:hypothetical protein